MALEDKFTELQALLAEQQTAIVNALDSILTALGAPPPTATVTLADTLAMMVALNNNVIGMAIANGTYHAAVLEALAQLNTNTDLMLTNNSLNAQRTIAAIYATFCECTTDTPLLGPPLDVTPTSLVDEAKCRRIQFYLSVFGNWLNKIANYGASGAAITGGTIATLLSVAALDAGLIATGAEVGAVAGPPGIVIGAVVGLIAVAVYTLGGSVLIDYANQFSDPTLRDNMVQALFAATNAEEGHVAFDTTLSASMTTIPAAIIKALWWTAWSNDLYSGTPEVDDSAFDGTVCGAPPEEESCHIYDFIETADHYFIARFNPENPSDPNDGYNVGNYNGWRFTLTSSSDVAEFPVFDEGGNFAIFNAVGQSVVIDRDTTHIAFQTRYNNTITSGTYEVCPPGTFIP